MSRVAHTVSSNTQPVSPALRIDTLGGGNVTLRALPTAVALAAPPGVLAVTAAQHRAGGWRETPGKIFVVWMYQFKQICFVSWSNLDGKRMRKVKALLRPCFKCEASSLQNWFVRKWCNVQKCRWIWFRTEGHVNVGVSSQWATAAVKHKCSYSCVMS